MKRREFLSHTRLVLALAAAQGIPGVGLVPALAEDNADYTGRYFLLLRVGTGWDVTLGLDPRVHANGSEQNDMYIEYRPEDILSAKGVRLAPAAKSMIAHAGDLCVVNGVFMSDANVSHEANLDYISTGDSEGHMADLSVEVGNASAYGPFGIVFNGTLKRAARNVMPTTTDNVKSMSNSINFKSLTALLNSIGGNTLMQVTQRGMAANDPVRVRLVEALKSLDGTINASQPSGTQNNSFAAVNASGLVAAAFVSGASYQGVIDVPASLDTHSNHVGTHLTAQTGVWDAIAAIFAAFKATPTSTGQSLFDRTTFMVVSEFARTSALNPGGGKDHNPLTNSVLLAGAGIRGGSMIGQSNLILRKQASNGEPRHVASPIDFTTGRAPTSIAEAKADNFQYIFPENVAATVAEAQGLDRQKFATVRADIPALATIVKK